jgi:hypothetical protein
MQNDATDANDSKEMLPIEVPPEPPAKRRTRLSRGRRLNRNWKSLLRERLGAVNAEHYES